MSTKYSFENDYHSGAHPSIFKALLEVNDGPQHRVYGKDSHCENAGNIIRNLIGRSEADVVFISGGTQTNLVALCYAMKPWEAVIAAETGHIAVHETGAIEATGHKVIVVPSEDGKLYPAMLDRVLEEHALDVHMVVPRVVFISQSTELGGLYSRAELEALRRYCDDKNLLLHLDGARLGSAMASAANDATWKVIGECVDSFYIGGTKAGAMFGEALVLLHPSLRQRPGVRHVMKQRGALMAKGWMLGVQFEMLLRDDAKLLLEVSGHANHTTSILQDGLRAAGFPPIAGTSTNMTFVALPLPVLEELEKDFKIGRERLIRCPEETGDDRVVAVLVRLVTMWNTKPEECVRFSQRCAEIAQRMK